MNKIDIRAFNGLLPRMNPGVKPDHCGAVAWNCDLRDGRLRPMRRAVNLQTTVPVVNADYGDTAPSTAPGTLEYVQRNLGDVIYWWAGEKEVAGAPVDESDDVRLIVSTFDGSEPAYLARAAYGGDLQSALRLSRFYKTPMPAPVISYEFPTGEANKTTRWRQAWVDALGYESPISDSSDTFDYFDGDPVTVGQATVPTGAVKRRLYKIVTGDDPNADNYYLIFEQDAVGGVFPAVMKRVFDIDAGESAPVIENPPEWLGGVISVAGGFYAGFDTRSRREVMFSDVGFPYSYPLANRFTTPGEAVVRLVGLGNSVIALTNDKPIYFTGASGDAMTMTVTASRAPLVSRRAVAKLGGVCLFASDDGIYSVQYAGETAGATNQTAQWFDRKAWRALVPETAFFTAFNDQLYAWFPDAPDERMRAQRYVWSDGLSALTTHDEMASAATTIPNRGVVALRRGGAA